ncbi:hypothetical protein AKI39_17455 [Bordetella sp. H567]|uniref:NEL-type E3 ubiquitin ligase domain-containing protein n=1 Tax=Bordetella sp. H567 TaxID=1697043 RepID=UPI00081C721F|nr:NEL-type E3 ubiquitin ligase domain-containing protein [Bordetella sp. H567]AOB32117.1 hypothetical protein AKI39_17455 [Bordetella sp. H567]
MAAAFATVRAPRSAAEPTPRPGAAELEPADALKLLSLWLPRVPPPPPAQAAGIVVPESIARDSRQRMAFKVGVHAARELGLDDRALDAEELTALGRQTVADHILAGTTDSILLAVARVEGKVDEAAWAARDQDKIAEQVGAFVQAEFADEIDLYQALDAMAAEPPLLGRQQLANALLHAQGVEPDVLMYNIYHSIRHGVSASSPPLIRTWKAGQFYFDRDTLNARDIGKMKMRGGDLPTDAQAARIADALPASLDAEFGRRFDGHKERMSTLLAQWLSARLSLHAREHAIDLTGATVTISRATMRFFARAMGMRMGDSVKYSDSYGTVPSQGFLVSVQGLNGGLHRCFISTRTGAVHVLPAGVSVESWLRAEHERVFEDAEARAALAGGPARWSPRVAVEEMGSGAHAAMRQWSADIFRGEVEKGREAARGHTPSEEIVDDLLNLIPFRAMVVALRKGDLPTAIVQGGLDVFSLLPLVGAGVRLTGAAARSAAPWLAMSARFGSVAGRQGLNSLRHVAGRIPLLYDRIKGSVARSVVGGWGRLRPLDVRRVAQALRPTAPRLADILDGLAARARGATIPDGVWRVSEGAVARAESVDAISAMPRLTARNLQGDKLSLLPYGNRAGTYTQIDEAGQRMGALLVADSGGWLHQTLPLASLERYRVGSPELIRTLDGMRMARDGTVALDGSHYARLGADYVQVVLDPAVSTGAQPIWRVVAPQGVVPDVIAYRLAHDGTEGLWRHAAVPRLAGGGGSTRLRLRGGAGTAADVRVSPDAAQLARLRAAMIGGVRGGTPEQTHALEALLDRVAADRRGRVILNAMSAHYELLDQAPDIVLRAGASAAAARPTLDQPAPGKTWHLDLEALRYGTTEAAVQELGAVYNNMTGVLQNEDPFQALLAQGGPPLDERLESAWTGWLAQDPHEPSRTAAVAGRPSDFMSPRESVVAYLRQQLREMRCYGGLDRTALKALLRNQYGRAHVRLNFSHRGLDSIPPLPGDTKALNVSNNPIRDWSNLPAGLGFLYAEGTGMSALPPNLPVGLKELHVSNNRLAGSSMVLPAGLERLGLGRNGLTAVPDLPDGLKELVLYENSLETLPARLPRGLELLDVSNNALTGLPDDLPPRLEVLRAEHNRLASLPDLPGALEELHVSWNRLQALPSLPPTLLILEAASNALHEVPANLPRELEVLTVSRNRLRRLPDDLPSSLTLLALQHNAIEDLPAGIAGLHACTIQLDGNPLAVGAIPIIAVGGRGPRIFFTAPGSNTAAPARGVAQVVRRWWTEPSAQAQARWDAIDRVAGTRAETMEFALFLDRLRTTASYHDAGFRAQIQDWLTELSKPERGTLLDETLAVCHGATQSCEDRLVATWNDLQNLRRNDDVRLGLYDARIGDVVDTARQMFRIDVLTAIARHHERGRPVVDPVELYLAYLVRLRDPLRLTTVAPTMRFYDLSFVTGHDLVQARETVLAREREEFDKYLVLDYEPWQTLLKRKDAQAYADAEQEAQRLLETTFEQRLREETVKLGLDPADEALLADARKDLGPGVMRELRYQAFKPLTDRHLNRSDPAPVAD